jgi:hypothetical protein
VRLPAPRTWLLLVLLMLWVTGIVGVVIALSQGNPPPGSTRSILLVGLVYGAISAAVSLAAWWLTLARRGRPERELSRHVLVTVLIVWLALSWQVAPTLADPVNERTVAGTLSLAWGYQWLSVAAVLWAARHFGGWHAGDSQRLRLQRSHNIAPRQFSIRSVLMITAVIAVVLAIGRETVLDGTNRAPALAWPIARTLLFCVAGGVCQAVVGLAAIWLVATGGLSWRLLPSLGAVAAACALQTVCYSLATGPIRPAEVATTVAVIGGAHFVALTVGLFILHATGYRLVRQRL